MNKKILIIIIFFLFLLIVSPGCFEESKIKKRTSKTLGNLPPIAIILAPDTAYFGETIDVSASESYDIDGEIVSYTWYFKEDDARTEGISVNYIYEFENNYDIIYPLIYSIHLIVKDNNGSFAAASCQIKLYPKEYVFYLDSQRITPNKPSSSVDEIRSSGLFKLRSPQTLTYNLENPILLDKCTWDTTIYLKKPLFLFANKLELIFFDNDGNIIAKKEVKLGLSLWTEKTVKLKGSFTQEETFKSFKISVYGLSIRSKIGIRYGGEKASNILFNFQEF